MYIAKKRIKQAIAEHGGEATFEDIADWTEYECIGLYHKLMDMLARNQLTKEDKLYVLGGAKP